MRDYQIIPPKSEEEPPLQQELFADEPAVPAPVFEPVLLGQLQDDLSRYRLREAFWISVVVHLVFVTTLALSPTWMAYVMRLFPARPAVEVKSAEDLLRERELTYLQLPPNSQSPKTVPEAKHLSDQNRIAQSPRPQIDQKTLDELRAMRNAQRPGEQAAPPEQAAAQPPGGPPVQPAPPQQNPQMAMNTQPSNPFGAPSAGSQINQAMRGSRGSFGSGGDAVFNRGSGHVRMGPAEIISDTQGVDFGPYLNRVVNSVRMNWYQLIPEEAMAPLMKKGKVIIEFAIMPNGSVAGLRIIGPSGDIALDRAAYGGITSSNPFQPLPSEFHGNYLALRFLFFYNPDERDMQ